MATPIGNLEDISLRAVNTLALVDMIAAEDTRITARLLEHHRVHGNLKAVHKHNEQRSADWIVEMLAQGKSVALVTDAGTPAISDPGAVVVARVRASGFKVVPIPGPNAAITALSAAGIADSPFLFAGFLPPKSAARRKALAALGELHCTLVFYEAPHRIVECVEDIAGVLGAERKIVIARELTKLFEQTHHCALADAAAWLRADPDRQRGEFVLIVPDSASPRKAAETDWEPVLAVLLDELPLAHAVKLTCRLTGAKRKAAYERALQLAHRLKSRHT